MERLQKISALFLRFFYLGLVFALPVIFSLFLKTNNVFELLKLAVFKILILLLVFFCLIGFKKFKRLILADSFYFKIAVFLCCYVVLLSINTFFFSINPGLSFHGTYDRLEGLEAFFYYAVFFFISWYFFQNQKNVNLALGAAFLSGLLASAYALAQAWGLDPLSWSESTAVRATSTFGQPNVLGSFMLMVIPLGAYWLFDLKKWWARGLAGMGLLLNLTALFYTYSTASWIGFFGSFLAVALIYIFLCHSGKPKAYPESRVKSVEQIKTKKGLKIFEAFNPALRTRLRRGKAGSWVLRLRRSPRMTQGIILFIILAATVAGIGFIAADKKGTLTAKIENALNWETGSTAARFDFWSAAWSAIKERPFLGYGLETQQEVLVKYYEPGWGVHSNANVRPSRAHNYILDTWLTAGLAGVIVHLLIWFYLFWAIIANIKANRERMLNYCLLFALSGFFIYLQFNYWHVTAWAYFAMYAAIIFSIKPEARNSKSETNPKHEILNPKQTRNPKLLIFNSSFLILTLLTALAAVFYLVHGEFNKYAADHYWWEIRRSRVNNEYFAAIRLYEFIREDRPEHDHYDQLFAALMADWLKVFPSPEFRVFGEEKLREILPALPARTFYEKRNKAKVLTAISDYDSAYFDQAGAIYRELLDYSPNFPLTSREYAYLLFKSGQYEGAVRQYEYTLAVLPPLDSKGLNSLHEARLKEEMAANYRGLIEVYMKIGDNSDVERYGRLLKELEGDR